MDSAYQQQLRDLNDLNWERFKAELHSAIAQSETRLTEQIAQSEVRVAQQLAGLMKWMFIYWSGSVLSLGGLMFALLRK